MAELLSLRGQCLLAMPNVQDSTFENSVVFIMEHNEKGAVGLVINKTSNIAIHDVLDQFGDNFTDDDFSQKILLGGPVSENQGFIIHFDSEIQSWTGQMRFADGIAITSSRDILKAIAEGENIGEFGLVLGYAGWDAEQLEQELIDSAWIIAPCNAELLLHTPPEQRYEYALALLGIGIEQIHHSPGHA